MERLLFDILNIDTQNPPGNERVLAAWIAQYLSDVPCEAAMQEVSGGRANVTARIRGRERGDALLLNGHLDTVPHGRAGWATNPGEATVDADTVIARGAADMKGGLAAALYAFRAFARSGVTPRRDILFAGTADEESGGAGARLLAESGFLDDVSSVVIGEPTGNALGLAAKGAIWLKVNVTGRVSHGAYPERGVNAIEGAMCFAARARALFSGSHPLLTPPTATVTGLLGGVKQNMVPDEAVLLMDIRTAPGMDHAALIDSCRALARGMAPEGLVIEIEVLNDRMAVTVSEGAPVVKALADCFQSALGRAPGRTGAAFFSDASIFLKFRPLDVVLFGPGESDQAHTPNERLSLTAFRESVQVYTRLIHRWAE